jgi:iron complex transport system permease protein
VNRTVRYRTVLTVICVMALCAMYLSLTNGAFDLSAKEIVRGLLRIDADADRDLVLFDFRLPRIVIGALVGAGLGVAGAALQGVTRNPLADPGILGIHAAAGTAAVLFMFFFQGTIKGASWLAVMAMPLFGWLGGMAAAALLFALARHEGAIDPQRLVLAGIALASGFGAATLYLSLKMDPKDFEMATVWLAGSIYSATWLHVAAMLPWLLAFVPILWRRAPALDLLQLDEVSVRGLGVRADRERRIQLLCCVGLVSACVSVSGSIGFVGLIAPHIARRLTGVHYPYIVPVSGAVGMTLVVVCDLIGKTVFAPAELPVGIVVSIVGVPYFISLLYRSRRK